MNGIRGRASLLTLLPFALLLSTWSPAHAQETRGDETRRPGGSGAVSPDSADAIRARMERPPGKPPFDAVDAVALPFRIAIFPIRLLGSANAKLVGLAARALRPREVSIFDQLAEAGFRPRFGTIGPRSGIAAGLRFDRWSPLYVESAYSFRESQRHTVGLDFDRGPYRLAASYLFRRDAEPHFWGIGPDTRFDDRRDYRWDRDEIVASASLRLVGVTVTGSAGYQANRVARGFDDKRLDLQDDPAADTLFGVNERTKYFTFDFTTAFDRTHYAAGLQTRGFFFELGSSLFAGTDGTDSDFYRIRGLMHGYIPANPRQVLALRGLAEINRGSGQGIPFTHRATMGSLDGSRAYRRNRFTDRDMVALMSEWRYEVWRELHERGRAESFLLLDTGAVGRNLLDISVDDLRWSFGFGMRLVWRGQTRWLAYVAFGEDDTRFDVEFSAVY